VFDTDSAWYDLILSAVVFIIAYLIWGLWKKIAVRALMKSTNGRKYFEPKI
jgi:hypothetical protein